MFIKHDSELEYRNGDSGPKYFIQGPRANFGTLKLLPGESGGAHYHEQMEENFFVLEGSCTFIVEGEEYAAEPGFFLHVEPGEVHDFRNDGDEPCLFTIDLAPYVEAGDKVMVEG